MREPLLMIGGNLARACEAEARTMFPLETGGTFMGHATACGYPVVDYLIDAGPGADHQPFSFAPDAEHQWSEMARLHASTQGRAAYLGDWHTHPRQRHGRLSRLDRDALEEILGDPSTMSRAIVFAILAGGPLRWRWSAHLASLGASGVLVQACRVIRV